MEECERQKTAVYRREFRLRQRETGAPSTVSARWENPSGAPNTRETGLAEITRSGFTSPNPLAPALSPLGRGEGVVTISCVGSDAPVNMWRFAVGRYDFNGARSIAPRGPRFKLAEQCSARTKV